MAKTLEAMVEEAGGPEAFWESCTPEQQEQLIQREERLEKLHAAVLRRKKWRREARQEVINLPLKKPKDPDDGGPDAA